MRWSGPRVPAGNTDSGGASGPVVQPGTFGRPGRSVSNSCVPSTSSMNCLRGTSQPPWADTCAIAFDAAWSPPKSHVPRIPGSASRRKRKYRRPANLRRSMLTAVFAPPPWRLRFRSSTSCSGEKARTAGLFTRDITEIEERVLEAIVRIICRELTNELAGDLRCNSTRPQRQRIRQDAAPDAAGGKGSLSQLQIKMAETRGTLNLAVPAVGLQRAARGRFPRISATNARAFPIEARRQIQEKLVHCYLPGRALLCPALQVPLKEDHGIGLGRRASPSPSAPALRPS